jgi:hypothetical protein
MPVSSLCPSTDGQPGEVPFDVAPRPIRRDSRTSASLVAALRPSTTRKSRSPLAFDDRVGPAHVSLSEGVNAQDFAIG